MKRTLEYPRPGVMVGVEKRKKEFVENGKDKDVYLTLTYCLVLIQSFLLMLLSML